MAPRHLHLSRRQIMRGILGTTAFAVTSKLAGCGAAKETASTPPSPNTAQSPGSDLVIGFIYVGPKDDFGYSQAHAEGAAGIAKLPGVKIVEQASVPETTEVQEAMRNKMELK